MRTDTFVQSAFNAICGDAAEPDRVFVSLYASVPFYGGPEEGGWWGHDTQLCAYQEFSTQEAAEKVKEKVEKLAKEMQEQSRKDYGQQCVDEIAWCEARGLDHETFLREPDGPTRYFVTIEKSVGSQESQGCRHYE